VTILKERVKTLWLRVRRGGWKVWLVVVLVVVGVLAVLKFVLSGGGLFTTKGKAGERVREEVKKTAGMIEGAIAGTRERIKTRTKVIEERETEIEEIKTLDSEVEKLRRLAELSNRTVPRRGRDQGRRRGSP